MKEESQVAATWERTDSLTPWGDNPRHSQPIAAVARSITQLGFGAPIVAQKSTRRIIAGHTRWYAAQSLGLELVPVRFVDIDDRKAELMVLADNKHGEEAKWDNSKLALIASRHDLEDLNIAGFDDDDLMEILKSMDDDIDVGDGFDEDEDAGSTEIAVSYAVIIECTSEEHQREILEIGQMEGWACRALT